MPTDQIIARLLVENNKLLATLVTLMNASIQSNATTDNVMQTVRETAYLKGLLGTDLASPSTEGK